MQSEALLPHQRIAGPDIQATMLIINSNLVMIGVSVEINRLDEQ